MKVKVCGISDSLFIENINSINIDFVGLIFYTQSKRYLMKGMFLDSINAIPHNIKKVGVFVNESIANINEISDLYSLDYIQLHGDENLEYIKELSHTKKIIKACRIDDEFDFASLLPYEEYCSFFLFDTKGKQYGGTGEKFSWKLLDKYSGELPFLLSGGILPNDIINIIEFKHSKFIGIDINSGFEIKPGIKNIEQIKTFITQIR